AERDQIGVALVVEPAAAVDELFAKIAEMRHRPAEGGQPEPQERGEDFTPAPARTRISGSGFLARRHRQVIAGRTAARYRLALVPRRSAGPDCTVPNLPSPPSPPRI